MMIGIVVTMIFVTYSMGRVSRVEEEKISDFESLGADVTALPPCVCSCNYLGGASVSDS